MSRYTVSTSTSRHAVRSAFTLVELLVVISIIALLISILLPSLKSAREQAKTVKCMAHESGIAKAAAAYESEENDWIPGSPNTTGSVFYPNANGTKAPVQDWDYAGPLAAVQMGMPLSSDRPTKFRQVTEGIFECPSNRIVSDPFGSLPGFTTQKMVSYNTLRNFMLYPSGVSSPIDKSDGNLNGDRGRYPSAEGGQVGGSTEIPHHYRPQVNAIGTPAEKVFISDSSRFTKDDGTVDHNTAIRARSGGAFSDGGPTLQSVPGGSRNDFLRAFDLSDPERRFTYRHPRGRTPGLVAAFYDTHAEYMTEDRSRVPDPWWPKGTTLPVIEVNNLTKRKLIGLFTGVNYIVPR